MRLHNTLSGEVEEFTPSNGEEVLLYVCGVTPYSESHLGHGMSVIIFDALRRYLEFKGWRVKHIQNYTDIDDKLIRRAEDEGVPIGQIAERFVGEYERDLADLNVEPATAYPRATQEVPSIVDMIAELIEKGYAYASEPRDGSRDVYYRIDMKHDYGKLGKRRQESMLAGARIEPLEGKENPMDFILWKSAKPGEPTWDSPWGPGRPGWHIECSAMSYRHLGAQIDIHGGGLDLVFPHHENEIAQTEAFTGEEPFARFWVHNGLLQMSDEKMSKSLGNLITLRQAIDQYGGDAVRLFVLGSTYRSPLTYSEGALAAAKSAGERLTTSARLESPEGAKAVDPVSFRERFVAAMEDDLNTAQALAALFDLSRDINRGRDSGLSLGTAQETLRELAGVLGLRLELAEVDSLAAAPFVELLMELRQELRAAKQFQLADRVRDGLAGLGIVLEDGPGGTTWKAEA